jgi:hypothetical protein
MMIEVLLDGGFELGHTLEDTASDSIDSDAAEEALDLVEHDADVGVKCMWKRGCRLSQAFTLACLWWRNCQR